MKTRFRLVALLLVLILMLATLAGCASSNKPLNTLKKALENTIRQRFGGEWLSTVAEALDGGMVQLTFGGADPEVIDTPLQAADLSLWLDRDELSVVADGSATVGGVRYDGSLFLNEDSLIVSSDALLGSTDLAIHFNTLTNDLKNSIFRNNSGTEYMISWLGSNAAADIKTLQESFFTAMEYAEEWYLMADELIELFLDCLVENLSGEWYSKDGRIVINTVIDNGTLSRSLRDLHEIVVNDGSYCRELRRIAALRDAVVSAENGNGIKTNEWTVWVENFIQSKTVINQWCDYVDNTVPPFALELNAAILSSDCVIETARVALRVQGVQTVAVALDLSLEDTNVISLEYDGAVRTLTYAVVENGISTYRAALQYTKTDVASGKTVLSVPGELNADRQSDFYELILVDGENTRRFTGSFDKKIDGFTFTVDNAFINGEQRAFSFGLAVDVDAKPPKAPDNPKNFFNLSHSEYKPIHNRATAALARLKQDWGDAALTPTAWLDALLNAAGVRDRI